MSERRTPDLFKLAVYAKCLLETAVPQNIHQLIRPVPTDLCPRCKDSYIWGEIPKFCGCLEIGDLQTRLLIGFIKVEMRESGIPLESSFMYEGYVLNKRWKNDQEMEGAIHREASKLVELFSFLKAILSSFEKLQGISTSS